MSLRPHDPRDIPVLTDIVDASGAAAPGAAAADADQMTGIVQTAQLAIVTETLKLADALLHQAAKDMEASLFERVYDRLRAQLPEIVDRVLLEHFGPKPPEKP